MNKKGFTLIEILAVIIIIGIAGTIGIVSVSNNISSSRDESVVNLAKNYANAARTMRGSNKILYEPKNNEAVIIPYYEIEGVEIENGEETGYGPLIPSYCYVGIVNQSNNMYYYLTQVDDTYHFISNVENNVLTKNDVQVGFNKLLENRVRELNPPFASFAITYGNYYKIKAARVEYDAKINVSGITKFETKELKGFVTKQSNRLELEVLSSTNQRVPKSIYIFTTKGSENGYQEVWKNSSSTMKIGIKSMTSDTIVFDILLNSTVVAKDVKSSANTTLYGYYSNDNSHILANADIKDTITNLDSFIVVKNNTKIIDGISYTINDARLLYLVLKRQ